MSNAIAHVVSFTPEGDFAKFSVALTVLEGPGGQSDIFLPLATLNLNISQINAELKAAIMLHAISLGAVFGPGDKVILLCGLV